MLLTKQDLNCSPLPSQRSTSWEHYRGWLLFHLNIFCSINAQQFSCSTVSAIFAQGVRHKTENWLIVATWVYFVISVEIGYPRMDGTRLSKCPEQSNSAPTPFMKLIYKCRPVIVNISMDTLLLLKSWNISMLILSINFRFLVSLLVRKLLKVLLSELFYFNWAKYINPETTVLSIQRVMTFFQASSLFYWSLSCDFT